MPGVFEYMNLFRETLAPIEPGMMRGPDWWRTPTLVTRAQRLGATIGSAPPLREYMLMLRRCNRWRTNAQVRRDLLRRVGLSAATYWLWTCDWMLDHATLFHGGSTIVLGEYEKFLRASGVGAYAVLVTGSVRMPHQGMSDELHDALVHMGTH